MRRFSIGKTALVLSTAFATAAAAFAVDTCKNAVDYAKETAKLNNPKVSCSSIIGASANFKNNVRETAVGNSKVSTAALYALNTNAQACGRMDYNLKYVDKFGMPRNMDIKTQTAVTLDPVPDNVLLPVLPAALQGDADLKAAYDEYLQAAADDDSMDLGKFYTKQIKGFQSARDKVASAILKSASKTPECVDAICKFLGGDAKDCAKQVSGKKAWAWIEPKLVSSNATFDYTADAGVASQSNKQDDTGTGGPTNGNVGGQDKGSSGDGKKSSGKF